jgi:hypothetical protein
VHESAGIGGRAIGVLSAGPDAPLALGVAQCIGESFEGEGDGRKGETGRAMSKTGSSAADEKADDGARALALQIQRALLPNWGQVSVLTASYSTDLCRLCEPLRGRDLTGVDTSAWLLPAHECTWQYSHGAAEHLPNPLWAWVRATHGLASEAAVVNAFDVLMRTGCDRPEVLNSRDGDGWSLMMVAGRSPHAFQLLRPKTGIDWSYVRPSPPLTTSYSILSEALIAGEEDGLHVLGRLSDDELTRVLDGLSTVMHRIVCNTDGRRPRTLQALKMRTGAKWPPSFPADTLGGSLPTVAMSRDPAGAMAGKSFWDDFSSPLAPWHAAFIDACNTVSAITEWYNADPLRAASMSRSPSLWS